VICTHGWLSVADSAAGAFLGTGEMIACLKDAGNRPSDIHLLKRRVLNGHRGTADSLTNQVGIGSSNEVLVDERPIGMAISFGRSGVNSLNLHSAE